MSEAPRSTPAKTRIITMTDRPPVLIVEAEWPTVATAQTTIPRYAAEGEHQTRFRMDLRRHADGRCLVYGTAISTHPQVPAVAAGKLVGTDGPKQPDVLAAVILRVAREVTRHAGSAEAQELYDALLAAMPPERLV